MVIDGGDVAGAEIAILGEGGLAAHAADDLLSVDDGGFDQELALGLAFFAVDFHLHAIEGLADAAFDNP